MVTGAGEDSSYITILKIEKYPKGDTIIHIRVDGVKIANSRSPTGYSTEIQHVPMSISAVAKSVKKMIGHTNSLPDFAEGYLLWKTAWDSGKAGYFTIPIKEAVNGIASVMQQSQVN